MLTLLLPVTAHTTTGQRPLDLLSKSESMRLSQLNEFISEIYQCAIIGDGNVIDSGEISVILSQCAELSRGKTEYEHNVRIQLTLAELTDLLRLIKYSKKSQHKISDNAMVMHKNSPTNEEFKFYKIATIFNQLFKTARILEHFGEYLVETLNRLKYYNSKSDYTSFIVTCVYLDKLELSFENKSRLIRIMSLVLFKRDTFYLEAHHVIDYFNNIILLHSTNIKLDEFLNYLSSIVPANKNDYFTIESLQKLLTLFNEELNHNSDINIEQFILSYYKNFKIDPNVAGINDSEFYQDQSSLDKEFPGLGAFYKQIKTIVLQRYPVAFGENKQQSWTVFLSIIKHLENHAQQQQILQMLLESSHHIDLTTLNRWLTALLKNQQDYPKAKFQSAYFENLSVTLLTHENRHEFIKIVDQWFSHSDWFPVQDNVGFIQLLNRLATFESGHLSLDKFYNIMTDIAILSRSDKQPWHTKILKLLDLIYEKDLNSNYLGKLFTSLNDFFKSDSNKSKYSFTDPFRNLIQLWLDNIEHNLDFTLAFTQRWDETNPQQCQQRLLILAHLSNLDQNKAWEFLQKVTLEELKQLSALYETQPVPSSMLFSKLMDGKITISTCIAQHISDPHNERDEKKLRQQFDNDVLWPYINKAKYLNESTNLNLDFARQFPDQLKIVNQSGYESFRFLSLKEIGERLKNYRKELSTTENSGEKIKIYLSVFALTREAVYKTSPSSGILWPSPIQTLAILSALNHQFLNIDPNPLFMQMATGEGKSLLAIFLGILTWAKGDPVTIVTHRSSLASRDVNAYARLFTSLNIECEHLTANGYKLRYLFRNFFGMFNRDKKPEFDGIYYAEFNDIASIKQQRLLDIGQDIKKMSFIVDEGDEIILHNQMDNNLTQTVGGLSEHPHAWVFQSLAAFLERSDMESALSVQMGDLVKFFHNTYPLADSISYDPEFLAMLPTYLEAAWHAQVLKEKVDFIPKKHENRDTYYAAVIINDKPMPPNVTFNGLIPQALHGKLNHESSSTDNPKNYAIAPESEIFSSMNPEAVLEWMKQCGTLIVLSATIGSNEERLEMHLNYGFDYIKLPKKQRSLRIDYPQQFCKNQNEQIQAIAKVCHHHTQDRTPSKARAILIVVDNIDLAEKINQYLMNNNKYKIDMLHAGLDKINDEMLAQVESQSGQMGHILIAMSGLISRGFDIKLSSAKQLIGITTYLKNGVDEVQVKGRVNRINPTTGMRDKGRFYAIYDLEAELKRYPDYGIKMNLPDEFKQQLYSAYYQRESFLRLHRQLTGITKYAIQKHFFQQWESYFKNHHILLPMRNKMLDIFKKALESITNVIPSSELNLINETGQAAREQYNRQLLSIYVAMLNQSFSVLGQETSSTADIIAGNLLQEITYKQEELLKHHQNVLSISNHKVNIINNEWNTLKSMGGFVSHMLSSLWVQENHGSGKKKSMTDFLNQLKQVMQITQFQNEIDTLIHLHEFNLIDTELLRFKTENDQEIIFIHDPLMGMASQIHFIGNDLIFFEKFQTVINQIYSELNLDIPLPYRISQEQQKYRIVIDFSGHQFDAVDRKKLFAMISEYYQFNTDELFLKDDYPSLAVMKSIAAELQVLLTNSMKSIPGEIGKYFEMESNIDSRKQYYSSIFSPLFKQLNKYYDTLSDQLKTCISALYRSNLTITYRNHKGQECIANANYYNNLSELLENDKKLKCVNLINKYVNELEKSGFNNTLLCRFQTDCLSELSVAIINSNSSQSLPAIFDKWLNTQVQYLQEDISVSALMQLRNESSSYIFGKTYSLDLSQLCKQINVLNLETFSAKEKIVIGYK